MNAAADFYETLPRIDRFADLSDLSCYHSLPRDWAVGVCRGDGQIVDIDLSCLHVRLLASIRNG